jgi:PD-(D/E)XK nuclease superfamily protein
MTQALSHSELRTFMTCKRRWYLTYFQKWGISDAAESPVGVMQLGRRIHLAFEAQSYGMDPVTALRLAYELDWLDHPEAKEDLEKEYDTADRMIRGYLEWVEETGADAGLTVLESEHDLRVEIEGIDEHPVILRGRLDQLVERDSDGALFINDFKTVGTLAKADHLILDTQLRFYVLLANLKSKTSGERIDGALYTMLKRSKRTAAAKPPFYNRVEIRYNRDDMNSMYLRVVKVVQEIQDAIFQLESGIDHRSVVYATPGDYCAWACPFLQVCPMMDDGSRWQDALAANFDHIDPYNYYNRGTIDNLIKNAGGKVK